MIALLQRVKRAACVVDGSVTGEIADGLLVYAAIEQQDTEAIIQKMADKIVTARIFEDEAGKLNLSVTDKKFAVLLISNFTLAGILDSRRPSFSAAKNKDEARTFFDRLYAAVAKNIPCQQGVFSATMEISSVADGPVNLIIRI